MPYRGSGSGKVVDDTDPQLGGDLDVNGHKITSADDGDVQVAPDGTGAIVALPGGNARGDHATDLNRQRSADSQVAGGDGATIGGGYRNTASGDKSTVSGGYNNTAAANNAAVGGGYLNTVSASYGTIPGGVNNQVQGTRGRAGGYYGKARLEGEDSFGCYSNYRRSVFMQHGQVSYNGGQAQEITSPEALTFENGKTYFIRTVCLAGADPEESYHEAKVEIYETLLVKKSNGQIVLVDGPTYVRSRGDGVSFSLNVDSALRVYAYATGSGIYAYVTIVHYIQEAPNGYSCGC